MAIKGQAFIKVTVVQAETVRVMYDLCSIEYIREIF